MLCTGPGSSSGGRSGRADTREWSRPGLARQLALSNKPKTLRVSRCKGDFVLNTKTFYAASEFRNVSTYYFHLLIKNFR